MKSIVIGFVSEIAGGKSSLSARFAEEMGWPYVSFGDYVRWVARQRGLDDSEGEILRQIGESLIEQDYEGFCKAVLSQASWRPGEPLVIDGIDHLRVKQALEKLVAPSEFILTYISVDEQIRRQRLHNEGIDDPARIERIESASTETQVRNEIPQIADITLDGTEQPEKLVEELKEKIFTSRAPRNDDPDPANDLVECGERTASINCKTEDETNRHKKNTRMLDRKVPPIIPPEEFAAKWELERKWMEENSQEFAGRWVALDGDHLVAFGASAGEVYAALKAAGISGNLVTRIKHPDDLPFIE
ncbi:MAG: AAA family ATPase [Blastocatellia bacterium]|nr:AAA family ATPase [Blastocatellia bacterium]